MDVPPSLPVVEVQKELQKVFPGTWLKHISVSKGNAENVTAGSLQPKEFQLTPGKQCKQARLWWNDKAEGEMRPGRIRIVVKVGDGGIGLANEYNIGTRLERVLTDKRINQHCGVDKFGLQGFSEEELKLTFKDFGLMEGATYRVKVRTEGTEEEFLGHWEVSNQGLP